MSRKLGFGIVGCGLVAPFHAKAIASIPDAHLVAFADPIPERAERLAREYGGVAIVDYLLVLERRDVDVVCICTPNGTHEEIVAKAAQAGKHLLVEKPLEVTLPRVDRIIAEAEKANVKLGTVFQCRFRPAVVQIKKALDEGRFGRVFCGDIYMKWYRTEEYYRSEAWRSQPEQGGGVLFQHASHYIDLLQWLVGPVESVMAQSDNLGHPGVPVEDTAMALLKYRNGAMGVVESSTAIFPGIAVRLEIHGEGGSAIMEGEAMRLWKFKEARPEDEEISCMGDVATAAAAQGAADFSYIEHQLLIQDMIDAIRQDREPLVSGSEGRKAVEIICAIHRSSREGRRVSLPLDRKQLRAAEGERT
ncbi:MAG: Gfo/Idh/MocA family protein [Terriglobia bacterium]